MDDGTPTMLEIYENHQLQNDTSDTLRLKLPVFRDESQLAYEVAEEVSNNFPLLHNPMLIMYVYPHVATESRVPIPGYWTAFPLYNTIEFALPGENKSSSE